MNLGPTQYYATPNELMIYIFMIEVLLYSGYVKLTSKQRMCNNKLMMTHLYTKACIFEITGVTEIFDLECVI